MIHNSRELYGNRITAMDGDIGTLKDFLFDDRKWLVRYVVANTGLWLPGCTVLLSPHSLGEFDLHLKVLHVCLQRKQVKKSPAVDSQAPVSRQYEADYHRYYGLPAYWPRNAPLDFGLDQTGKEYNSEISGIFPRGTEDHKHLRSAKDVSGYRVEALDGNVGHVSGFLIDDRNWSIPAIVVENGHWYSEKQVLVSPNNICQVSYEDSTFFVNLTKSDVRKTPDTDLAKVMAGGDERNRFHD